MRSLFRDIRYALRSLLKNPGFALVAVLTLALGIGANSAIFSIVERVLMRPLPYPEPGRLVQISNNYVPLFPKVGLSPGDYKDWKEQNTSFSALGAYSDLSQGLNLTGDGDPQRVQEGYASSSLFPLLGVWPAFGRNFQVEEDRAGNAPVVILSHQLWQNRFGGDPKVVGSTIQLDYTHYTVVGVLPAGFDLLKDADVWLPLGLFPDDLQSHVHHDFYGIARLKPGVTLAQARAEIETLSRREESAFPDTHKHWGVNVQALKADAAEKFRATLLVLLGAVGLVLLIACANIVNLLLVRNSARDRELAVRVSLGAGPGALIRQLLVESLVLSFAGGLLGLAFAVVALRVLLAAAPAGLAGLQATGLNLRVFLFTACVCLAAGLLCGLLPAAQSIKTNLMDVLRQSGKISGDARSRRIHGFLVAGEIALALVPLIGASLLLRSLQRMLDVSPGFQTQHVLSMQVPHAAMTLADFSKLSNDEQTNLAVKQSVEFEALAEQIRSLPGVQAAGGVTVLPLSNGLKSASRFIVEGQPIPESSGRPVAQTRTISLGYFSASGIPLLKGRLFRAEDWRLTNIIVNEEMQKRFWPSEDPVGKRINLCSLAPQPCWFSIVGVVGNVHQFGLDAPPTFDVYYTGGWTQDLLIRATGDPEALTQAVRETIHTADPTLPIGWVTTMDNLLQAANAPRRFVAVLVTVFAGLALFLAAVGVYGVMSYTAARRTQEIGIRMALGAHPSRIQWMILGQSARLAGLGVLVGVLAALAFVRYLSSFLFGVSPYDWATFVGIPLLLAAVALIASYLPARRAVRVDPLVALRHD